MFGVRQLTRFPSWNVAGMGRTVGPTSLSFIPSGFNMVVHAAALE